MTEKSDCYVEVVLQAASRRQRIFSWQKMQSVAHRLQIVVYREQSVVYRQQSVVHGPKSVVYRQQGVVHRLQSAVSLLLALKLLRDFLFPKGLSFCDFNSYCYRKR